MSDSNNVVPSISEVDINRAIKVALIDEFGVDVKFQFVTVEIALKYITFTVVQRVKQRLNSKKEREEYNMLKKKHPELFKKLSK